MKALGLRRLGCRDACHPAIQPDKLSSNPKSHKRWKKEFLGKHPLTFMCALWCAFPTSNKILKIKYKGPESRLSSKDYILLLQTARFRMPSTHIKQLTMAGDSKSRGSSISLAPAGKVLVCTMYTYIYTQLKFKSWKWNKVKKTEGSRAPCACQSSPWFLSPPYPSLSSTQASQYLILRLFCYMAIYSNLQNYNFAHIMLFFPLWKQDFSVYPWLFWS